MRARPPSLGLSRVPCISVHLAPLVLPQSPTDCRCPAGWCLPRVTGPMLVLPLRRACDSILVSFGVQPSARLSVAESVVSLALCSVIAIYVPQVSVFFGLCGECAHACMHACVRAPLLRWLPCCVLGVGLTCWGRRAGCACDGPPFGELLYAAFSHTYTHKHTHTHTNTHTHTSTHYCPPTYVIQPTSVLDVTLKKMYVYSVTT